MFYVILNMCRFLCMYFGCIFWLCGRNQCGSSVELWFLIYEIVVYTFLIKKKKKLGIDFEVSF